MNNLDKQLNNIQIHRTITVSLKTKIKNNLSLVKAHVAHSKIKVSVYCLKVNWSSNSGDLILKVFFYYFIDLK